MDNRRLRIGGPSPWGAIQSIDVVGDGVYFVETPSHGGFFLEPSALGRIDDETLAGTFNGLGLRGWFEEDCDWRHVARAFPDLFPPDAHEAADAIDADLAKRGA